MKKSFTILLFLLQLNFLYSQLINGTIVDENDAPLYGVSVYFDGTTIGTTTNEEGFFELSVNQIPNASFVISYIGYETVYLSSFQLPINIKLHPSAISLREVVLEPIPFSRKEMLTVFREQFLGKTKGGKNCEILNENAIQFSYTSKEFKLEAFADEKLIITNNYLGYKVEFELVDFFVTYGRRTLSNEFVRTSYYAGTTFYQEITDSKKDFEKNRINSYLGSPKHFFKSLIENRWDKKGFILFDGKFATDANLHFESEEVGNLKLIKVKPKEVKTNLTSDLPFFRNFNILYDNKEQSIITFKTSEFYVDYFGNNTHIDKILFSGEISKKRFGDMLPINYELPAGKSTK